MRFRLTSPHYINDVILPEDTIVDGDLIRMKPSLNMEAADEEAQTFLENNPNYWAARGERPPVEILQAPNTLSPGQRVGGVGPKPDAAHLINLPGQGLRDAAGNTAVDPALAVALAGRPHNPFAPKV